MEVEGIQESDEVVGTSHVAFFHGGVDAIVPVHAELDETIREGMRTDMEAGLSRVKKRRAVIRKEAIQIIWSIIDNHVCLTVGASSQRVSWSNHLGSRILCS